MRAGFLHAREGGVSIVSAVSLTAALGFAGFATDVGFVYLQSRRLQGAADLAALAAAQDPAQGAQLARDTVHANHWPQAEIVVAPGRYTPDRAMAPRERFAPGAANANAVRVELTDSAPLYFGRLFFPEGRMTIRRAATAAQTRMAAFQIGSRLLALRGGAANALLSALAGGEVSLSAMDYDALLSAEVDLLAYVEALRARLDLEAATYEETLAGRIGAPAALDAIADTLAPSDRRSADAMRRLADSAQHAGALAGLDDLIDLGPYAGQDQTLGAGSARIRVGALDLATAILEIAGGDRQVRLALNAELPRLIEADVWLAIGERPNRSPWLAITADNAVVVRTAQTRLYIEARIAAGGALAGAAGGVRAPILIEAASAQARLDDIECGANPNARAVTLSAAPSLGALSLGEIDVRRLDDFKTALRPQPAQLVRLGAIRIEGQAHVEIGGDAWQTLRFDAGAIERGAVRTVATRDIARASIATLLSETQLSVRAGGLRLDLAPVTAATEGALAAAAGPLDSLVNGLTDFLGVRLGEADVRVNGVRCNGAALVA